MKYLLIMAVTATPLAVLSARSSVSNIALPSGTSMASTDSFIESCKAKALASSSSAGSDSLILTPFRYVELVETRELEFDSVETPATRAIRAPWSKAQLARSFLHEYAAVIPNPLPSPERPTRDRKSAVTERAAALKGFVVRQRPTFEPMLSGSSDIFDSLERTAAAYEMEARSIQQLLEMESALAAARESLRGGKFRECRAMLDVPPLSAAMEENTLIELGGMRRRIDFCLAAQELLQKAPTTGQLTTLHDELAAFLQSHKSPPTAEDGDMLTKLEEKRRKIELDIAIDQIRKRPTLDGVLAQAETIVRDESVDDGTRARVREQVVSWFRETAFASLQGKLTPPTSLLGKQEAELKNGQRRIGLFFLPEGTEQYRFWTDATTRGVRPKGDQQLNRTGLVSEPGTPKYVTWAERYNFALSAVLQNIEDKEGWTRFADECRLLQKELEDYQKKWGQEEAWDRECAAWSFRARGEIADEVLKQWSRFVAVAK